MGLFTGVKDALGYDSQSDRDAAEETLEDVLSQAKHTDLPELQKLILENPKWLEDLQASTISSGPDVMYRAPELERAHLSTADNTAFDNVAVDPRLKDQQLASLAALEELADGGGMNASDRANLARIQSQTAQADRGRRDAIMQGMQRRGMGGSGAELLAQLQSSQAATDRASAEGMNVAGMAQDRALKALMEGGNLAGGIRTQDFGEQAQVAQARDAIAKFNAQNANQMSQYNVGQANNFAMTNAGNQLKTDMYNRDTNLGANQYNANAMQSANQFNIQGRQGVANTGTATQNKAAEYNNSLPQQQFDNKIKKIEAQSGAAGALANQYNANADRKDDEFGQIIGGAATVGGAVLSDERCKKDKKEVKELDLDVFMASIQPKKFRYKNPADGEGDRTGVMAQDLLKSKLGREAVVQTDDGTLGYDKDKMQGIMLAALKHLFNKVEKKGS
jgi:hypothetical protein